MLPWEPTITPCGSVTIPLSSGEWDLVLHPDGSLLLICNVPDMEEQDIERRPVYLGEIEADPADLLEAINLARNPGLSIRNPN